MSALLILISTPLAGQWQRLEALSGIQVGDFEVSQTGVICAVPQRDDGFYVSETDGNSWIHRSEHDLPLGPGILPSTPEIEVSNADLFLLAYNQLYRIQGFSSALELIPPPRDGKIGTFDVTPDGILYATLVDNPLTDSVYVSADFGNTWMSICKKYSFARREDAMVIDSMGVLWSNDPWSIGRYDPQTYSWIRYEGIGFEESNRQRMFPQTNGDIYSNCGNRIVKYSSATATVSTLYTSNSNERPDLEFWRCDDGYLLVSDRSIDNNDWIVLRSSDDGANWISCAAGLPNELSFLGENAGVVFGTYGAEIVKTDDNGASFQDCTAGLYSTSINHFETRGNRVHVMAMRYAMSGDGGESWNYPGYGGSGINPYDLQVTADGTMYENRLWFRVSRDSTRTWEYPRLGDMADLLALDDVVLASMQDGVILRSIDKGRSGNIVFNDEGIVFELTEHAGYIYGVKKGRLLISSDRGITWEKKPFPASVMTDAVTLGVNDRVILIAGLGFLWSSTDRGDSWTEIQITPLNGRFRRLVTNRDGTFAAVYLKNFSGNAISQIAMLSTDDGQTWTSISAGLPHPFTYPYYTQISDIGFTSDNRLLVNVQGRGLYEYDGVPVTIHSPKTGISSLELSLWPTVTANSIQIEVETTDDTEIIIYNSMGRSISKTSLSTGDRGCAVDVRSWPAGTYFLHARSANRSVLKPFVVLR
ncbi:MAG: T9SS type A sorting domain-containing protein [Bacteroidota bacterium]